MRALVGLLCMFGCVSAGSWPVVPSTHYTQMGKRLRSEYDWLKQGEGLWVQLPVRAGDTVIVDVQTTHPVDVFFVNRIGLDDYKAMMRRGSGSVATVEGGKFVKHFTRTFTAEERDDWWVVVDNTSFPDGGARSPVLNTHVQVFAPKDELLVAMASRPRTTSTAAAEAHDGTWRGKTSQNRDLAFTVKGGAITYVSTSVEGKVKGCKVEQTCPEGKPCGEVTPAPVVQGRFSLAHASGNDGFALRGTFTSPGDSFGELAFLIGASQNCAEITGTILWTATKQ